MGSTIRRFIGEEAGQDLVEYAFLLAFIAVAVIAILANLGGSIRALFTNSSAAIGNVSGS